MLRTRHFLLLILAALTVGTATFFVQQADYPLTYDEGDYLRAVERGFWTNYTDADELPLTDFVRLGIQATRDARSRAALSDMARNAGTTMFLRHYHAPLAFYPAIALQPLLRGLPVHARLRAANLFWILLWILVLAAALRREDADRALVILLLPASTALGQAVVGFNMHLPFGLLASLFLYFWQRFEEGRDARHERLALLFLAAAVVTVEYGLFLLALLGALTLWRFLRARSRRAFLRRLAVRMAWLLFFLLLLWPAGILQLNLFRSWAFVAYIALFRLGAEKTAFHSWQDLVFGKWNASPLDLLLMAAILAFFLWHWRRSLGRGSVVVSVAFIIALFVLQRSPTLVYRWYLFPAFAIAFLPLARLLPEQFSKAAVQRGGVVFPRLVVPVLAVAMFGVSMVVIEKPAYPEIQRLHEIVDAAPQRDVLLPRSIYPQLPPYHPGRRFHSYHDQAFETMAVGDSLHRWVPRSLVILPAAVPIDESGLRIVRTPQYRVIVGVRPGASQAPAQGGVEPVR